jgi:hypothetical protein
MTNYSGGKLKPLGEFMKELKAPQARRAQTADEMVAALRVIRETLGG